ncbi:hypothetical protein ACFPQ1_36530 [Rhodocytophaga aerolata]|uniref:hypothetical protein n=1 Tax=Rhodocytophaga aerolata TaxID=455078 RepID=UPI003608B668
MCRYGFIEYKNTYACFNCRKGFKRRLDRDLLSQKELRVEKQKKFDKLIYKKEVADKKANDTLLIKCPDCGDQMVNLGKDLRLPKKDKQEQWMAIEYLANNNFNFFTCGCDGIGVVPQNLQEAYKLMEERRRKTEGEKLLEKIK